MIAQLKSIYGGKQKIINQTEFIRQQHHQIYASNADDYDNDDNLVFHFIY